MALNHLLLKDCIKVITALFHQPTKWRFLYLSMAVFLLSSKNTLAFSEPYLNPVIAFDAGINTSFDVGTSQNFPAADTNSQFYDYTANTSRQSVGLAGIFLGYEWEWRTPWLIQTGISYHQSSAFTAKGTLTQGLDTASQDTYQYQYDILVRQLLIESKWLYTIQQYHPPLPPHLQPQPLSNLIIHPCHLTYSHNHSATISSTPATSPTATTIQQPYHPPLPHC